MGSGRKFNKTNVTRPTKNAGDRRRRHTVQKARLIGLGVSASVVDKMNSKEIRNLLKRPAKIPVQAS